MKRSANAIWTGNLKSGEGKITAKSGLLEDAPYGFASRFEDGAGTNPEELIAAAHAGCYSMALSHELDQAGMKPESVETKASVTLEKKDEGFAVTKIHLTVTANVPGADEDEFNDAAQTAKTGCPISKLLNAEITLDATLNA